MSTEFYILITQYDTDAKLISPRPPQGPFVHEGFLMTFNEAQARALQIAGRYGWAVVAPVNVAGLQPKNQPPEKADENDVPF